MRERDRQGWRRSKVRERQVVLSRLLVIKLPEATKERYLNLAAGDVATFGMEGSLPPSQNVQSPSERWSTEVLGLFLSLITLLASISSPQLLSPCLQRSVVQNKNKQRWLEARTGDVRCRMRFLKSSICGEDSSPRKERVVRKRPQITQSKHASFFSTILRACRYTAYLEIGAKEWSSYWPLLLCVYQRDPAPYLPL